MRRAISLLCLLAVSTLTLLFFRVAAELPGETAELVREKYAAWSGVLRLWTYEGWDAGATGWLNRAVSAFEKAHPGVYIHARAVDAEALRAFAGSGVNPPDMLLFPPGLLDGADGLLALDLPAFLRGGLAECGHGYAVPVLMGAYAWAYDRRALDGLPVSLENVAVACPTAADYAHAPAALVALCSGGGRAAATPETPGLDLGLPVAANAESADCVLPADFAPDKDACAAFVNGRAALLAVTQRELRRLTALAEAGRGPDWATVAAGEAMLADQLLLLGVVDWPRDDLTERQELCRAFLDHLLDVETQADLSRAGVMSVRADCVLYAGRAGWEALEAAANLPLLAPDAFARDWRGEASAVAGEYMRGALSARAALEKLRAIVTDRTGTGVP